MIDLCDREDERVASDAGADAVLVNHTELLPVEDGRSAMVRHFTGSQSISGPVFIYNMPGTRVWISALSYLEISGIQT